jgi:ubiquinone/menaquinone biosynthesis C-methylase UbiE
LDRLTLSIAAPPPPETRDRLPETISDRTRRVYDAMAVVYPLSSLLFHSKAHRVAIDVSGIRDGMNVIEVATGSGEMFRRLVKANPRGHTIGVDLSPNMAARTQRSVRRDFPSARTDCKAVDARYMPFRDESFDAVVCCYLLELLGADDIESTLREFQRILRPRGRFTLVTIGQYDPAFNQLYKVANRVAPAFWGRQVEERVPELIESMQFRIVTDRTVRQGFYPSRVLAARK